MLKFIVFGTRDERILWVHDAEKMVKEYGWQDRTVHPYSYPVKITEIINDMKDYDKCTQGSQGLLIQMANFLTRILKGWEEQLLKPKMNVVIDGGKVISVDVEFGEMLINEGVAKMA